MDCSHVDYREGFFFKIYFWHFFCLYYDRTDRAKDRSELTGSEVGAREGSGIRKGLRVGIRTRDCP